VSRALRTRLSPASPPPGGYTAEEQATLAQLGKFASDGMGYSSIQGTRPQILGGGHFAALEQPELFVAELRKSFAQVR
jgi:pimeloyl-ACP methyl ester carboxylesterase